MVLNTSLLNTQRYKVRIKGKVEQSKERISVLPSPRCSSYWKRSLLVTNFTYLYIYISLVKDHRSFLFYDLMLSSQAFVLISLYQGPIDKAVFLGFNPRGFRSYRLIVFEGFFSLGAICIWLEYIIIIIIKWHWDHGFHWLSPRIRPYHPSLPANPPNYFLCPHCADVDMYLCTYKGLSSTFQPPEEGRSVQRPKRCDKHGDKDEDNSPKNVNNIFKFKLLI